MNVMSLTNMHNFILISTRNEDEIEDSFNQSVLLRIYTVNLNIIYMCTLNILICVMPVACWSNIIKIIYINYGFGH